MAQRFDIYTDGACTNNGRPDAEGGWAFVMTPELSEEIVPGSKHFGKVRENITVNSNRAELEAMHQALLWLDRHIQSGCFYTIFCDSLVVINGITGKGSRSSNRDLWAPIETLIRKHRKQIGLEDVAAHVKNSEDVREIMNNYVDTLAKEASKNLLLEPVSA